MQIQPFFPAVNLSSTELTKLQPSSNTQDTVKLKNDITQGEAAASPRATSSITISISGLTSPLQSQGTSSKSISQLGTMLETSLKMQTIRNDASIPEQAKDKMLNVLEQANKALIMIAEAKAEKEEKSKMIEDSNEDAEAIRNAGEESSDAKNKSPISVDPTNNTTSTDELNDGNSSAFEANSSTSAPNAQTSSSSYSGAQTVGGNIDTTA